MHYGMSAAPSILIHNNFYVFALVRVPHLIVARAAHFSARQLITVVVSETHKTAQDLLDRFYNNKDPIPNTCLIRQSAWLPTSTST